MINEKECLAQLDVFFNQISRLKVEERNILDSPIAKAQKDEILTEIQQRIEQYEEKRMKTLATLLTFPPFHIRHSPKLKEFHQYGCFEKSVFIMTKFPEGDGEKDIELREVIDTVVKAIKGCGFIPRIASDREFHEGLWDNVETYLFGCKRGVAIVESKYKNELNPNVMMEWGWMRGMGKEVLYLVEKSFDLKRADISGLIQYNFTWELPQNEIKTAIQKWLKDK